MSAAGRQLTIGITSPMPLPCGEKGRPEKSACPALAQGPECLPRGHMATQDVGCKVLARAAAHLGGSEALAAKLDISHRVLQLHLTGQEPVSDALVLRAVDVILAELLSRPTHTVR